MEAENSEDPASTKSSISLNEPETQAELMTKMLAMISIEKIPGIMAVRKGRVSFDLVTLRDCIASDFF